MVKKKLEVVEQKSFWKSETRDDKERGQNMSTEGRTFSLCMANLGSISGISYGLLTPTRSDP